MKYTNINILLAFSSIPNRWQQILDSEGIMELAVSCLILSSKRVLRAYYVHGELLTGLLLVSSQKWKGVLFEKLENFSADLNFPRIDNTEEKNNGNLFLNFKTMLLSLHIILYNAMNLWVSNYFVGIKYLGTRKGSTWGILSS